MQTLELPTHLLAMPPYPWQQSEWSRLVTLAQTGKLAHALLVSAQPGLGIEQFAFAFAQYRMCMQPQGQQACRECKACKLMNAGTHPDLKFIVPEEKSEQLKVDQIREVNAFLAQTSQQGSWKVVVLAPAHAMNQSAANALLKNLEEPAQRTLFILVSAEAQKILATIRSRCHSVLIAAPDSETVLAWLQKNGLKDPAPLVQRLGTSPLLALDWHNNNRLQDQQKILSALCALNVGNSSSTALARDWGQHEPDAVLLAVSYWLEDEIRKFSVESPEAKQQTNLSLLFRFSDRLRQKRALLASSANINAGLLVDELIYDLMALARARNSARVA